MLLDIVDIGSNGEGIAHQGEKTVFVPFTIVGEKVLATSIYEKKDLVFAKLKKVLVASPYREMPKCPYFTDCGGCDLQHLNYQQQLKYKANSVVANFKKIADYTIDNLPIVACDNPYEYRNKLQMPIVADNNGIKIGFFKKGTHQAVDCRQCALHGNWAAKLISVIHEYAKKYEISGYSEESGKGMLRHLVARKYDNICVTLVINGDDLPTATKLYQMLCEEFNNPTLYLNINKAKTNVILGSQYKLIGGSQVQRTSVLGINVDVYPNSFMQVNDTIRDAVYLQISKLCDNSDLLIDAYSGAGLLSVLLADNFSSVYAVEIVEDACKTAENLVKANGMENKVSVIRGDCGEVLPTLLTDFNSQEKDITLLLDPPRKGCDSRVISAVTKYPPKKVIYLSCNSATLCRDIAPLLPKYSIDFISAYDMFPQTANVETVVHLVKKDK